jgi:transmembrane sensor
MATSQQLFEAIDNYLQNKASEQETLLINTWYHSFNDEFVEVNTTDKELLIKIEGHLKSRLSKSTGINMSPVTVLPRSRFITITRIAAAAAILVCVSVSIYFFGLKKSTTTTIAKKYDVAPGGNKAILTLANGQQIILNNTKNGTIATQSGSNINKKVNG